MCLEVTLVPTESLCLVTSAGEHVTQEKVATSFMDIHPTQKF